jgi:hypothetical protein
MTRWTADAGMRHVTTSAEIDPFTPDLDLGCD